MSLNLLSHEQIIEKEFEYAKAMSPHILDAISSSELQLEFRKHLENFRQLSVSDLTDSYMFYVSDTMLELNSIFPSSEIMEILGILNKSYITQQLRFVFPILDMNKVIHGFIGYDYDVPKYKYLINIAYFSDKSTLFFNGQHIPTIYKKGVALVEEGIADSIMLNGIGLTNNLSLMGKNLTEHHARLLNRLDFVLLIPDNDAQGLAALKKWTNLLTTDYVIIKIRKRKVVKKRLLESGEIEEFETTTKDLDDVFRLDPSNKDRFITLYNKILSMKNDPFIRGKEFIF